MANDDTTIEHPFAPRDLPASASAAEAAHLTAVLACQPPFAPGVSLPLHRLVELELGRSGSRCAAVLPRALGRAVLRLPDRRVSRGHAALYRDGDSWSIRDERSKNGTFVEGQRVSSAELRPGALIQIGGTFLLFHRMHVPAPLARSPRYLDEHPEAFSTLDGNLRADFNLLERVARTDIPIIVEGATGTGKELTATAIHERSGRKGPFVPVNCGALPESLVESELFGTRRGAFSGATEDRKGLAQEASGGTLFLDEIVELSASAQSALLRLLQDGELRPVGATRAIRVNIRIVAATHENLEQAVATGRFREDLYARLAGHVVRLPPLHERRHDLGLFVTRTLERALGARADNVRLTPEVATALLRYPFPRNMRELDHVLRRAVALAPDHVLCASHFPQRLMDHRPTNDDNELHAKLVRALMETGGNVTATGRRFGKAPIQIRRWCARLGIDLASFRAATGRAKSAH